MKQRRSKRSRLRGKRTCGYGSRKKHRGKGSQRGHGMAGTGKMAGQRVLTVLKEFPGGYLGKHGFKSKKKKLEIINVGDIEKKFKDKEIKLNGFKILSKGRIANPLIIHANSFSKKAEEKIKAAGGKAVRLKFKRPEKKEIEKKEKEEKTKKEGKKEEKQE